ncbi:CG4882 [Drosophila busckii]|uniref:CG4882 n=1 Tax=Drosophila busckii TaxID=30019 RepID=A0A0M4EGF1_DROBS|nr:uncharacterized protein LOC108596566 [Drosophila busckii]XP_017837959.1 uncharacterized protein LOC108596566 [Drosophila busckii]XP_017837960.1 uncharacterized protein LOC108596566 [Drosophila busckii]ALC42614.1 CG4882 [Drosophila busckii]
MQSRVILTIPYRRYLSYLSSAFNSLALTNKNVTVAQQNVVKLDLDIFVNQDNRQIDLLDKLVRLRKQKECSNVPLFPNILVNQLLDYTTPQDVITVLRDPLQYGVFIDKFSGCHLMDYLINNGHALEAAQVAALLIERDLSNNDLTAALTYRSFCEFIKNYDAIVAKRDKEKVAEPSDVQKVRVKFLRNYEEQKEITEDDRLGVAMIKLGDSSNEYAKNIALVGFALVGRYAELEQFIKVNQQFIYKDVLRACAMLMSKAEKPEVKKQLDDALKVSTRNKAFDDALDANVQQCAQSIEPKLIAEYAMAYENWQMKYQSAVREQSHILEVQSRVENVKATLNGLEIMRQKLWFFENKEDIDIQIFKKKVYYPKRWFGKKKKPKAVDALYVPPTISRAN